MDHSSGVSGSAHLSNSESKSYPGVFRFSVAYCLCVLVIAYVSIPFLKHLKHGILVEELLITVMMLFSLLAVGRSHRTMTWAVALVVPAYACKWINICRPSTHLKEISFGLAIIFCLFVSIQLLRFIFRAEKVDSEVLCASVVAYMIMALAWAFCYDLIALIVPGAFEFTISQAPAQTMSGFTGLYFSFITLNTVGYGDIVPVSSVARMFAMAEATFGMFYMVMVISRLVSLYSYRQKRG